MMARPESTLGAKSPLVLRRAVGSRLVGALMYLAGVPVAAFVVGLVAAAVTQEVLKRQGVPLPKASTWGLAVMLCSALGVVAWGVRDFRRRAFLVVTIDEGGVCVTQGRREWSFRPDALSEVRLIRRRGKIACVLRAGTGARLELPADVANFETVREAMEHFILPAMVARSRLALAGGQTIGIPCPTRLVAWHIVRAAAEFVTSLAMIASLRFKDPGIFLLRNSITYLRQCAAGWRGGFHLSKEGLSSPREPSRVLPYASLTDCSLDDTGCRIHVPGCKPMGAFPYAPNYWHVSAVLAELVSVSRTQTRDEVVPARPPPFGTPKA